MLSSSRLILSGTAKSSLLIPSRLFSSSSIQCKEHKEHDHHSEGEHHDDAHAHHGPELSESESIFNVYTITAGVTFLSAFAYNKLNESYRSSHNGESIIGALGSKQLISELDENFLSYRDRVAKATAFQEMLSNTSTRTASNLITRVDSVPGRYFPHNTNAELGGIRDWENLAPRKIPKNPYLD
ncbi:hypothetical protein CANARDRAFT_212966 [[Candida] arabinofermentans NRRL YB-2248]|uniref:Uncharacterized protein n=1 Tax=[Candida] arabinofermentans NRRL YB-2248 TaxID=983967 RepID=A0A1E4SZN8_9ASCO|nr:hypothetical protein CANARDRAFT_212966 [[Candida] arabinofermentans NRRL YB-2248]